MSAQPYTAWFQEKTLHPPYPWQEDMATKTTCGNRLIRIPTGMGKTLGILSAWAYHRLLCRDEQWPRRLVWCLPMRVLVEQTEQTAREFIQHLGVLWDEHGGHKDKVGVHLLMGGVNTGDWHLYPEECSVLIGTQDMLLSRALNRGYAAARARWPMEFGLLNQDCLWVMDEIQLMSIGLATSAQLQTFREQDAPKRLRNCSTWWMSATLQPEWLKSVDARNMVDAIGEPLAIGREALSASLGKNAKLIEIQPLADNQRIAGRVAEQHRDGQLTLVVLNRVKDAVEVADLLRKSKTCHAEIKLVHSRFRPAERERWRDEFLNKDASMPSEGRIIVATQVVEAGVDISAELLITDLAPWPSLVQRFGRCARFAGQNGRVIVADRGIEKDDSNSAAPYTSLELAAAREYVGKLRDAGLTTLEDVAMGLSDMERKKLYPYEPMHLLLRRELDELFDTTPDLTGADLDISRFIRSGDERDVQVCWLNLSKNEPPPEGRRPPRKALCPVPFLQAQIWIFGKGTEKSKPQKLLKQAWIWDYLDDQWRRPARREIYPGQVIAVAAKEGGYDKNTGFNPSAKEMKDADLIAWETENSSERSDSAQAREDNSLCPFRTIADHGRDAGSEVVTIAHACGLASLAGLLNLVGRWHDWGKAHSAFQDPIQHPQRPAGRDLAKAPKEAWTKPMYRQADGDRRPGFRHELAGALALFDVLARFQPDHPALLGSHRDLMDALKWPMPIAASVNPSEIEKEVLALNADEFNALVYLVCAHHGKVRGALHAAPKDQDYKDNDGGGMPIRGIREGDALPTINLATPSGKEASVAGAKIHLDPASIGLSPRTGASWTERVQSLLAERGPFALAYLETLVRAADIRVSRGGFS